MDAKWLIGCLVVAGCATTGSGSGSQAPQETTTRIETLDGTVDLRTSRSDPTAAFTVAATPERVFRALTVAYSDLDIPATTMDSRLMRLGVENRRIRRSLGNTRLSRFLECGERMGQLSADSDEILLTLYTQVEPRQDGGSVLRTLVSGTARQPGSSTAPVNCATTGELERRIVELVRRHVSSS